MRFHATRSVAGGIHRMPGNEMEKATLQRAAFGVFGDGLSNLATTKKVPNLNRLDSGHCNHGGSFAWSAV